MEVLKRMGLSLGLERGQVSAENLARAQSMVPKALEQYVTQLAENGPGEKRKALMLARESTISYWLSSRTLVAASHS